VRGSARWEPGDGAKGSVTPRLNPPAVAPALTRAMTPYAVVSALVGATLGFAYHRVIGCATGACPITANPYISTAYGALMGYFVYSARGG
jgi:hypothetical protein